MTDTKNPAPPLPSGLSAAIEELDEWTKRYMYSEDKKNRIDTALYHYTDARGLKGIFESETIWFTDYRHLNDPSELTHGIKMAHDVMNASPFRADAHGREFLDCLTDMLSPKNFSQFKFFVASFSRDRDQLNQWQVYADNGRGYAIGFKPRLFQVEQDGPDGLKPNEITFVGPMLYDIREVKKRQALAINKAVSIFLKAINANAEVVEDESTRDHFIQEFCRNIISAPLIWNCLTSKHPGYRHEREVRLLILNQEGNLTRYIQTRRRGSSSEPVPYIPHSRPIRKIIKEIVVGPAAGADAEPTVRAMLDSFKIDPNTPIRRSDIPYRAW
jgi:hypothetical protein